MTRRPAILIIITVIALIILLFVYQYVFSIYEIIYSVTPEHMYADYKSTVTVAAVPLNSFGRKAPLRSVKVRFEIKEGSELINIVTVNEVEGYIILRAKGTSGNVVLIAHSDKSLFPSIIEIQIYPVLAEK